VGRNKNVEGDNDPNKQTLNMAALELGYGFDFQSG
jgi:hypothetical protein